MSFRIDGKLFIKNGNIFLSRKRTKKIRIDQNNYVNADNAKNLLALGIDCKTIVQFTYKASHSMEIVLHIDEKKNKFATDFHLLNYVHVESDPSETKKVVKTKYEREKNIPFPHAQSAWCAWLHMFGALVIQYNIRSHNHKVAHQYAAIRLGKQYSKQTNNLNKLLQHFASIALCMQSEI